MTDFPQYRMPAPPILTPWSPESLALSLSRQANATLSNAASATWGTDDSASFYPFRLYDFAVAYQLLFYVGATSSGSIDVGIYDAQLRRIVSAGSTAMSVTTNTVQELNIADTPLPPGNYFLAGACDNTTGTCFQYGAGADEFLLPNVPIYQQTGLTAATLTNPGTPAISTEISPKIYAIGIQFRPSVF